MQVFNSRLRNVRTGDAPLFAMHEKSARCGIIVFRRKITTSQRGWMLTAKENLSSFDINVM